LIENPAAAIQDRTGRLLAALVLGLGRVGVEVVQLLGAAPMTDVDVSIGNDGLNRPVKCRLVAWAWEVFDRGVQLGKRGAARTGVLVRLRAPGRGERRAGEGRVALGAEEIDHGCRHVAQAHGLAGDSPPGDAPREDHDQGNMDLRLVKAEPVAEVTVFAELFTVVGGENQQGLFQHTPALQLADQPAQLVVERGDAVVVAVARKLDVTR